MPRAWIIDAIYHYLTDQPGIGNTFTRKRFYTYFRLVDSNTQTYRVVANHGRAYGLSHNGMGTWTQPKHPEGDQETIDFICRKANGLLATGYKPHVFEVNDFQLWVKDPDSNRRIHVPLGGELANQEAAAVQAVPIPESMQRPLKKNVWLSTYQLKIGLMHFYTVSGDGWLIPYRNELVDGLPTSEVLAHRPPAHETGLALAQCEYKPDDTGGFNVKVKAVLEYHPNASDPERCSVRQFITP